MFFQPDLLHSRAQTITQPLIGSSPLAWRGTAQLTFSGNVGGSKNISVVAGKILFASTSNWGAGNATGTMNVATGATLEWSANGSAVAPNVINGVASGGGAIIISGASYPQFTASNTWTGAIAVKTGATFAAGTANSVNDSYGPCSSFTVESGGTLDTAGSMLLATACPGVVFQNNANFANVSAVTANMPCPATIQGTLNIANNQIGTTFTGVVTGAPGTLLLWDAAAPAAGLLFSNPSNAYQGNLTLRGDGQFQCSAGGTINGATYAGTIVLNTTGFISHGSTVSQTWSGNISGTGSIRKSGVGTASTLVLTGNNTTFTGPTVITAGILQPNAAGGGTAGLGASSSISIQGSTSILDVAGWTNPSQGGTLTLPPISIAAGSTLRNSSTLATTIANPITVIGTGTCTISDTAIGTSNATTVTSPIVLPNSSITLTLNCGAATAFLNMTGIISGPGKVNCGAGSGTVTLSGANTYTGTTSTTNAKLKAGAASVVGASGPFGLNSAVTIGNSPTSALNITGFNVSIGSLAGTGVGANGGTILGAATLTVGGNNLTTSYTGIISGTGNIAKEGTGVQTLTGVSTYTGTTTVNNGTLRAGASATVFGVNSAITTANIATAVLDLNGFNVAVGSIAGGGTTGGNITLGAGNLTHGGNNSSTTYAGIISGTGGRFKVGTGNATLTGINTFTGPSSVTAGTLTVATIGLGGTPSNLGAATNAASNLLLGPGTLSYTGVTDTTDRSITITSGTTTGAISVATGVVLTMTGATSATTGQLTKSGAGTLLLNGVNLHTGLTTLSVGSLGGTGSLAGALATVSGTHLFGGIGAGNNGTLTVSGTLAFPTGSILDVNTNGSTNSKVGVAGAVTAAGSHTVNILGGLSGLSTFTLINNTGASPAGAWTTGTNSSGHVLSGPPTWSAGNGLQFTTLV